MNEKVIWDFLYDKTHNAYGTAAVMGNLMAESSLNPKSATGSKNKNYVSDADSGAIDFIHDGVAFGLVQWCFRTRKEGLLNYAKACGTSVGDITTQLNYMWTELQKYTAVFDAVINGNDIRTISDLVMLKYERPAGTGEAQKKKRADYGQKFYDQFAKKDKDTIKIQRSKVEDWQQTLKNLL